MRFMSFQGAIRRIPERIARGEEGAFREAGKVLETLRRDACMTREQVSFRTYEQVGVSVHVIASFELGWVDPDEHNKRIQRASIVSAITDVPMDWEELQTRKL